MQSSSVCPRLGHQPRQKPVSVSAIPVIFQGVCHQAQPCDKAQEWPNRPSDIDWRSRESLRPQQFGCLVACPCELASYAGNSLSAPRATSARQILSLVLNKEREIPRPSPQVWGLGVGLHPHLVKIPLSRWPEGRATARKQAEGPQNKNLMFLTMKQDPYRSLHENYDRTCVSFSLSAGCSRSVAYPGIFFGGGVFNNFSWGQRTERTGIWGQ